MDPASGRRQEYTGAVRFGAEGRAAVIGITGEELGRANPQDPGHAQDLVGAGHDDLARATAAARMAGKRKGSFAVEAKIQIQRPGF
jgi:hypothetical protein